MDPRSTPATKSPVRSTPATKSLVLNSPGPSAKPVRLRPGAGVTAGSVGLATDLRGLAAGPVPGGPAPLLDTAARHHCQTPLPDTSVRHQGHSLGQWRPPTTAFPILRYIKLLRGKLLTGKFFSAAIRNQIDFGGSITYIEELSGSSSDIFFWASIPVTKRKWTCHPFAFIRTP